MYGAVIDLTPADGLLAQAALHASIPYTGLVFTWRHADEFLQRLQYLAIAVATREGDTWYDPRLVESLTASKLKANEQAKTNATLETKAGTKPTRKKKRRSLQQSPHAPDGHPRRIDLKKKSGLGEDDTNKTMNRRAQAKDDADTEAGDPCLSSERSSSTGEESGESCGTE